MKENPKVSAITASLNKSDLIFICLMAFESSLLSIKSDPNHYVYFIFYSYKCEVQNYYLVDRSLIDKYRLLENKYRKTLNEHLQSLLKENMLKEVLVND